MAGDPPLRLERDGAVMVITLDQDCKQTGNRPLAHAGPGTLQQLGQFGENRGRIAFIGRRFTSRQPDFPLCHGDTGNAVDHAKHVVFLIPEMLGDGERQIRRLSAHKSGFVGRRDDDHAFGQPGVAEILLQELLDLASPFADQPDDVDVRGGIARQHGQ